MNYNIGLNVKNRILKRSFDILFSALGLILTWWIILVAYIVACIDTRANGFFVQKRMGKNGKVFNVIKIRSMRVLKSINTNVTTDKDPRITKIGKFFRKTKIDELPQLINVLVGNMSFVGPRPDVLEMFENLKDEDKIILSIRPGITGPATLMYRREEEILANVDNPELYNKEVIFPDKIRVNKEYIQYYNFIDDIKYIVGTVLKLDSLILKRWTDDKNINIHG